MVLYWKPTKNRCFLQKVIYRQSGQNFTAVRRFINSASVIKRKPNRWWFDHGVWHLCLWFEWSDFEHLNMQRVPNSHNANLLSSFDWWTQRGMRWHCSFAWAMFDTCDSFKCIKCAFTYLIIHIVLICKTSIDYLFLFFLRQLRNWNTSKQL